MKNNAVQLGFIGIGLMGEPMTLRLLNAGYQVLVWARDPAKLKKVIEAGATPCRSISEVCCRADIILFCLADTNVVEKITIDHILPSATANTLIIDLSSIDPQTTRDLAQQLFINTGAAWVDAPVSGGVTGAENGNLAIMAGGLPQHIEIAREVLRPLYQHLTHMGPIGSGQISKICNQMIVSCNVLVIAEMMALAKQAGIEAEKLPAALAGGFADSKPLQVSAPIMVAETFEPIKWRVKTLLKDLQMAVDLASSSGSSIPMSALAKQLMQLHSGAGYHDQDPATLIKMYDSKHEPE